MRRLSFPFSLSFLNASLNASFSVIGALVCIAPMVSAANYPTIPYDATYRRLHTKFDTVQGRVVAIGESDYRVCTDGTGHVRVESQPPTHGIISNDFSPKTITIFDYQTGLTYLLLEKQKQAVRTPLKTDSSMAPLDDKRIKELNGRALGAKTLYGHPCHGWEYDLNGVKTECWTADDLGCPIHTVTTNADQSGEVLHLYKFDKGGPNPEELSVPSDFKISDIAVGQGRRVQ
jgi:hypothetical protein